MKRRILFVDDDANLLQGLKRMLRPLREEWEMEFVSSGHEALACLDRGPVEVIVSDVRMPGMNGVELLTEVKTRHPHTVRLLLSGHSDAELIMSAINPVHQYLAKPCDPNALKTSIAWACALNDLVTDERLKRVASQMETMPTLPSLYLKLEEELKSPDSSIDKAPAIISQDVGMVAKILKLVNSAFFGVPQTIADPTQAVIFLGVDTLKTLVLTVKVFDQVSPTRVPGFSIDRLWQHSLSVGEHAGTLSRPRRGSRAWWGKRWRRASSMILAC